MDEHENSGILLKNDPSALIDSVRESILRKISEINSRADAEIGRMEGEVAKEIEELRAKEQKKYDDLVAYEEGKAANLFSIDIKKQRLEVIDSFIGSVMSRAAWSLRSDSRYPDFLKWCVLSALRDVSGPGATVLISPHDAEYSEFITAEIKNSGFNIAINIIAEKTVTTGGAMVIDDQSEVLFNNTAERIIYRKADEIKRVIVRFLNELTDGADSL